MTDVPMQHIYCTDFGDISLSGNFVKEAEQRWPGERVLRADSWLNRLCGIPPLKEPMWHAQVEIRLLALSKKAYLAGGQIKAVKSLSALESA